MKLKLALLCSIAFASVNATAACYTVYDRANHVLYNSQAAPVDMSRPLHETVPFAFPGGSMVFNSSMDCPRVALSDTAVPARPSPLLTDRRTAESMHLRHAILPSGVALVNNAPQLGGGFTVIASTVAATKIVAPATVAQRASQRPATLITEMHNPPLTVVQQGAMVVSELR